MARSGLRKLIAVGVLAGAGAGVFLLSLAAARVREAARRDTCRRTLRCIALACHMYADDADGEFPSLLQQLQPTYCDNPKIFSCPSCPSNWMDFAHGTVTELSSSYILVPGLRSEMPQEFVLIYEKPGNHGRDGFHVVRCDARAEWWPVNCDRELEHLLELQAAAVARWRRSGRPASAISEFISPELAVMLRETEFPSWPRRESR
jgi:hypothetical protein